MIYCCRLPPSSRKYNAGILASILSTIQSMEDRLNVFGK